RTDARVRRLGPPAVGPDGQRAVDPHEHGALRLALLYPGGAAPEWSPTAYPARQGARRFLLDQRAGVRARQSARLRALGGRRRQRLGLRGIVSLIQTLRAA